MNGILTLEQLRWIVVSIFSTVLSFFTPTENFLLALIIMFAFNIWCGMRADGVVITRCKNFSMSKFVQSLIELFLYVAIILVVFSVMQLCGDTKSSIIAIKSLTYVFMYVYLQNSFKNLIKAYPKVVALHLVYHVIRLEFQRAMPSRINEIVKRYEREHKDIVDIPL